MERNPPGSQGVRLAPNTKQINTLNTTQLTHLSIHSICHPEPGITTDLLQLSTHLPGKCTCF